MSSCMEENRKRRKKDDVSEMKNYVFVSFFFEKCAKDNSKTQVCFFLPKFFFFVNKNSNNKEGKHNDSTHKERTNREEVKRKSKENQSLFKGFFWDRNKEIQDIFTKKTLKEEWYVWTFLQNKTNFFLRSPKRRLIKENQEK